VSRAAGAVEQACVSRLSAVVSAEPAGAARFRHPDVVVVQNWPRLDEIRPGPVPHHTREPLVVYVGSITATRGALEMARAVGLLAPASPARVELAGPLAPPELEHDIRAAAGTGRLDLLGYQGRAAVRSLLARARVGLVVLHPTPQYLATQPVKLFEYMAAGIPYVASDFPLWRELAGDSRSGLFVDPRDPAAIAGAISWLLEHPDDAARMGARGREHVERALSWDGEAPKLLELYERLLAS
jgi:glycosyltransferase involved in cell wall biosynthesis